MLILTDPDVASMLEPLSVRSEIRAALRQHSDGRTGLSAPPSQFLKLDGQSWLYHVKGAFSEADAVAGVRVSGFPGRGMSGLQMMVLTELATALPLAIVATTTLASFRVGGMIALTIETLRSKNAKVLAVVGSGRLAFGVVRAVQATTPFGAIRVAARSTANAERFCATLAAEGIAAPTAVKDAQAACEDADVIMTLTDTQAPIVQAGWCKPGSLLVSAGGGQECEEAAILTSDKIFVDDWTQCTLLGDIAALNKAGKIARSAIAGVLPDVISGKTAGRTSDNERIVAIPQGMALLDMALSHFAYKAALKKGLGQKVDWPLGQPQ